MHFAFTEISNHDKNNKRDVVVKTGRHVLKLSTKSYLHYNTMKFFIRHIADNIQKQSMNKQCKHIKRGYANASALQ